MIGSRSKIGDGLSLPRSDLDVVEPEDAAVPLGSGVLGRRHEAPGGDVHPSGLPREAQRIGTSYDFWKVKFFWIYMIILT
jgi:hypothetical protein